MNFELDENDIERIATKVFAKLAPLLNKDKENSQEWLTVDGVAEMLKKKKSWVYRKTQLGEIPYTKPGKYVMFRKDKIEAWLRSSSIQGRVN